MDKKLNGGFICKKHNIGYKRECPSCAFVRKQELEQDYIKRWGNAQKCSSCGYVTPYGTYSKKQKCCGEDMELVIK